VGALSCDELKEPIPTGPDPVPPPPPTQLNIAGHWEASTDQGRRIAFDVTEDGEVINGRINLHHDCNTGRWRVTFDGFEAQIVDSVFITTMSWKNFEKGLTREGVVTISGRFESAKSVRGAFINSVNDVRKKNEQPSGDVCPTIEVSYEGSKEP
jgi:hypothetical protein